MVILKNECGNISLTREKLLLLSQAGEIDGVITHLPQGKVEFK